MRPKQVHNHGSRWRLKGEGGGPRDVPQVQSGNEKGTPLIKGEPSIAICATGRLLNYFGRSPSPLSTVAETNETRDVPHASGTSRRRRDNKTPLELFIASIRGWEVGLRLRIENAASEPRKGPLTPPRFPRILKLVEYS